MCTDGVGWLIACKGADGPLFILYLQGITNQLPIKESERENQWNPLVYAWVTSETGHGTLWLEYLRLDGDVGLPKHRNGWERTRAMSTNKNGVKRCSGCWVIEHSMTIWVWVWMGVLWLEYLRLCFVSRQTEHTLVTRIPAEISTKSELRRVGGCGDMTHLLWSLFDQVGFEMVINLGNQRAGNHMTLWDRN